MATLTIGGKTVVTQTGTDEPILGPNVILTNTLASATFPAGHVIQKKIITVVADVGGTSYSSFTGFSDFDISLSRTSNTHAIYEVIGSAISTEAAGRIVNIAAKRSDGATYSGVNEVALFNDTNGGNAEYFSNAGNMRAPLVLKAVDTANITGTYTYRFFAKNTGAAYFALNGGGDIFVCITEFIPTV